MDRRKLGAGIPIAAKRINRPNFSRGTFGLDFFTKARTMRKDIDAKTNLIVIISVAETVGSRYA